MKTELEVARDAVRSAGLEELADALEWAAAAVKHRDGLMKAAVEWFLNDADCPECGCRSVHHRTCEVALAFHALDKGWSHDEIERAHVAAWDTLRVVREQRRPTIGSHLTEATLLTALNPAGAVHYPASAALPLPPGINDGVGITLSTGATPRITTTDGMAWELQPAGPSPDGGITRLMHWVQVATSPQPAQPQPEDDVTPPASPPPAR